MQVPFKFFVLFSLCFVLSLVSGCGGGVPSLTPAEQAEVDKILAKHGRDSLLHYLKGMDNGNMPEDVVLKYVKYFVAQGADVNAKGTDGYTPIHYAVAKTNVRVVEFLLAKGADGIDTSSKGNGAHLLWLAAENRNRETFNFLLSKGVDVKTATVWNSPLLYMAASAGNFEAVQWLVDAGADVNATGGDWGYTPLQEAIGSFDGGGPGDHISIIRFLVSRGADVNVKYGDGRTFLDAVKSAVQKNSYRGRIFDTSVVEYLEKAGAKSGKDL